jgi:hypothetical protein
MKKIGKYLFPIFFVLLFYPSIVKGQKNSAGAGLHEVGAGIGALNYTGDISPGFNFSMFRPGGMLFYRFNISPVVSLRGSVMLGNLHVSEKNLPDPVPSMRQAEFSTQLGEVAATVEYNFFNYRPAKNEVYRYSPYLTTGIASFNCNGVGGFQLSMPLGIGLKYRLNRRLNFGAEIVARKTFTDKIDRLNSYYVGTHQTVNSNDRDWYYYAGFSLSWTAFSVICPAHFAR